MITTEEYMQSHTRPNVSVQREDDGVLTIDIDHGCYAVPEEEESFFRRLVTAAYHQGRQDEEHIHVN